MKTTSNRASRSKRGSKSKTTSPARIVLITVLIFCAIGCVWVSKEAWHERLSSRALDLKQAESSLMTTAGYLRKELLVVTEYPSIVKQAREVIGMTVPQHPPDTIWCSSAQPKILLGSSALFKYQLQGMEL